MITPPGEPCGGGLGRELIAPSPCCSPDGRAQRPATIRGTPHRRLTLGSQLINGSCQGPCARAAAGGGTVHLLSGALRYLNTLSALRDHPNDTTREPSASTDAEVDRRAAEQDGRVLSVQRALPRAKLPPGDRGGGIATRVYQLWAGRGRRPCTTAGGRASWRSRLVVCCSSHPSWHPQQDLLQGARLSEPQPRLPRLPATASDI